MGHSRRTQVDPQGQPGPEPRLAAGGLGAHLVAAFIEINGNEIYPAGGGQGAVRSGLAGDEKGKQRPAAHGPAASARRAGPRRHEGTLPGPARRPRASAIPHHHRRAHLFRHFAPSERHAQGLSHITVPELGPYRRGGGRAHEALAPHGSHYAGLLDP